ncbi:MAG: 3-methyl-2-oxobutanoate dehydrogenase subunit VorB [Clostridia bacterium]|nr:3-methyl-2-oxobutanoate dehydrogenase subunit VorB [Clostridia bacterium]
MAEKILMKGNEALAEAAIRAGCRCFFGYPITPQTQVAEYMAKKLPKIGGVYMQSESEVSAINMVMGAAATGARAMTSSSSPGISLKAEGISYIAGCDLPAVIVNMQRGGPGLGGIQPAQSDYYQATKGLAHGDFHLIVLAPSGVQEIVDLMGKAFDLADNYRMPVMILGDGMLGQMMEPITLPEPKEEDRSSKTWATCGTKGERKRNVVNSLYIQPDELERLVRERYDRYAQIERDEVMCEEYLTEDADIVIAAYGAAARIAKNAIAAARAEGIKVGLLRPITLWPFPKAAFAKTAEKVKAFLTVEMSMGQMVDDVKLAIDCKRPVHFFGRTGGVVPTPAEILAELKKIHGGDR